MGTPLKNPPVYFTLTQVHFNPLLKLQEFVPAIQEQMRKVGFPDFSSQSTTVLQINVVEGRPAPVPVSRERFTFGSIDKFNAFVLDQDSLTLQTTQYGHFDEFSASFLKGLELIHGVVELSFVEQMGLRYLDRVIPLAKDALESYLHPEVLGLSAKLKGNSLHSYSETLNEVDGVVLRARVVIQEGPLSFPPDLNPDGMEFIPSPIIDYSGKHAILDNDGIVRGRANFDAGHVAAQLNKIHEVLVDAFRAAVTDHAFAVWSQS